MNRNSTIFRLKTIIKNIRRIGRCDMDYFRPDRLIAINSISQRIKNVHADSLDHVISQADATRIIRRVPYINPIFTVERKLGTVLP